MTSRLERLDAILRHAYTEPRFVAQVDWGYEYGVSLQLERQVGYDAMRHYAATGQHLNPDQEVELAFHEQPDWDWWEPTSQWRRIAARDREFASR